jgi:hypothetical protein
LPRNIRKFRGAAERALAVDCAAAWANDGALDGVLAGIGKRRIALDTPSATKADHAYAAGTAGPRGLTLLSGGASSSATIAPRAPASHPTAR